MKLPTCVALLALVALALAASAPTRPTNTSGPSPSFDIDALLRSPDAPNSSCGHDKVPSGISVSGLSSGACMANQLFVAYSSIIDSLGSIAGVPWFASGGNVAMAQAVMKNPSLILPEALRLTMINTATIASIDPVQCLANTTAFLFAGTRDSVVHPDIARKVSSLLLPFGVTFQGMYDLDAEHTFPTLSYGNKCDYLGANYISACDFDTAHAVLEMMYPSTPLNLPVPPLQENFFVLRQDTFAKPVFPLTMYLAGLDSVAYAYIPQRCRSVLRHAAVARSLVHGAVPVPEPAPEIDAVTAQLLVEQAAAAFSLPRALQTDALLAMRLDGPAQGSCRVHFALHGCQQTRDLMDTVFVENTGYNRWAESNDVVVIYPFARANVLNPKGCWDWWGYSGSLFATKMAPQTVMLARMAAAFRYNADI